MKALVYTAPLNIQWQELAEPQPLPDAVLVSVAAVGICGSDLHAFRGHDPRRVPPLVLGHEFVGTVVEDPGPGAPLLGRRVSANPIAACGRCHYCLQERSNLCTDRRMIGMNLPGAFAERLWVPRACLVSLPEALTVRAAALVEPAATVVHALRLARRVEAAPPRTVLVIGAGAIGLLAVAWWSRRGVPVCVVESNPLRLPVLAGLPGVQVMRPDEVPQQAHDLVFDAVGAGATRDLALHSVAAGGVVLHVGLADLTTPLDWRALTLREVALIGCYTYNDADLAQAAQELAVGDFGDLAWVEERPLSDGPQAFDDLVHGRVAAAKVVLRPGQQGVPAATGLAPLASARPTPTPATSGAAPQ